MDDLVRWLGEQLDADEREVRDRLCVNCGTRTAPLQSDIGVYGYAHEGDWQGRRCPERLTGAEPVQRPERVLREIEAKRRVLGTLHEEGGDRMFADIFRLLALPYADRPGYQEEWTP